MISTIGAINHTISDQTLRATTHAVDSLDASGIQRWVSARLPDDPIPIPRRMVLVLVDTLLLVIGTTFYRLCCPDRVQEFTQAAWVEKYRQPRLRYLAVSWSRRWLQWPTLVFSVVGAALAAYLIVERLYSAFVYIF